MALSIVAMWEHVSKYLINRVFKGKIWSLDVNAISIIINAVEQNYKIPTLDTNTAYRSVILQKTKYGLFVDLGLHFSWKFGSIMGLVHRLAFANELVFNNWQEGDEMPCFFCGHNEDGQLILANSKERVKWLNGDMEKLIGSIQKISVVINDNQYVQFFVLGQYYAKAHVNDLFYPNSKTKATTYLHSLKNGQIIECEIVKINRKKNCFILKFLLDSN